MTILSVQAMALMLAIVAGYWCLPARWRLAFLSLASVAVLGCLAPMAASTLAAVTITSFAVARSQASLTWRGAYGVALLLGLVMARSMVESPWLLLGAAFYLLKVIHVVVSTAATPLGGAQWQAYAGYLLYPPTFAVGPIQRYPQFTREASRARWDAALFSQGLERLLYGFFFLVVLSNELVSRKLHFHISTVPASALRTWLDCLEYGAALYLTFAGYTHIAIGFANVLCMRVPENFNHPYRARNIGDFWRRWHITLGAWCRDYVNTPVMAFTRNRALAIVASMLVLGLWHETSLRYLLWGGFHGLGIVVWRSWQRLRLRWKPLTGAAHGLEQLAAHALTLLFVVASFAITKEPDLQQALQALRALIGLD